MIKSLLKFTGLGLLAVAIAAAPGSAFGQSEKPKTETKEGAKKPAGLPFKGKIDAIDKAAQTITVGTRTFQVTSTTRIMKGGKPATFADATVGEEVGGSYKDEAGKLNLVSLRIGPKPEGTTKPAPKKPATPPPAK